MLTAAITTSQDTVCGQFTVNDTTDYTSEPTSGITSRVLTLYKSDGTVQETINWPYTDGNAMVVDGLTEDMALNVVMVLTPVSPQGGSTYTIALLVALVCYTMTALSERAKRQSEDPRYENNVIFTNDTHRIIIERDSAANAVVLEDIESAQLCLSRAKKIIDNGKIPY